MCNKNTSLLNLQCHTEVISGNRNVNMNGTGTIIGGVFKAVQVTELYNK